MRLRVKDNEQKGRYRHKEQQKEAVPDEGCVEHGGIDPTKGDLQHLSEKAELSGHTFRQ